MVIRNVDFATGLASNFSEVIPEKLHLVAFKCRPGGNIVCFGTGSSPVNDGGDGSEGGGSLFFAASVTARSHWAICSRYALYAASRSFARCGYSVFSATSNASTTLVNWRRHSDSSNWNNTAGIIFFDFRSSATGYISSPFFFSSTNASLLSSVPSVASALALAASSSSFFFAFLPISWPFHEMHSAAFPFL